jgi:hypothetical protein
MKTKDLIAALQKADPSGELECCVGNVDIHFVDTEPAYYDGSLQVLIRDESKKPYFDIVGGKYVDKGTKVVIHTFALSDLIFDFPDAKIDLSELSEGRRQRYEEHINKTRQKSLDIHNEIECGYFVKHIKNRVSEFTGETDIENLAKDFFAKNLQWDNPLPTDIPWQGNSYVDRRNIQWEREIEVITNGIDIEIRRKNGDVAT